MPKLAVKDRKKVAKAEATKSEFEPLTPGKYTGALMEVEEKTSQAGNKYWNITYNDLETIDGERVPGRQWYMLMLTKDEMPENYKPGDRALKNADGNVEKAWEAYQQIVAGRIKEWFEAHGYSLDTDTDEMIGERAVLKIGVETINSGARAGERTNRVNAVLPLTGDEATGSGDGDDEF
jgi:hypothetical protein